MNTVLQRLTCLTIKMDPKMEFGLGVTNLFNDTSINKDSFNQLFSQTRSYIIQPRYIVFRLKYDLTAINAGGKKSSK